MKLLFMILLLNVAFMQCDYDIGDINSDNLLDVIDIIEQVDFIMDNNSDNYDSIYDLNFDNIIDILDIIELINRILFPPFTINFDNILYDFQDLQLSWEVSDDSGFIQYNIYYSNIISNDEI